MYYFTFPIFLSPLFKLKAPSSVSKLLIKVARDLVLNGLIVYASVLLTHFKVHRAEVDRSKK